MKLTVQGIQNGKTWEQAGIALPRFDVGAVRVRTQKEPAWVHFGAGNIFRAYPCAVLQRLLDEGLYDRGVIACETYDPEIIEKAYAPYDDLSLLAILRADGSIDKRVIAAVTESLVWDEDGMRRMAEIFESPSLQMVSMTVTEKAYVAENPMMTSLCLLLARRFEKGGVPLAMVSMDNCSHNGEKLRAALLPAARAMTEAGKVSAEFPAYMENVIAFPNTMIDKITPHPAAEVAEMLERIGFEDANIIHTSRGAVTAAFVNAEKAEYLVIEDAFPNGRPPLDRGGVIFTDRETVDKVEKMKVGTCLNPLHTALAILGCLLGYQKISSEMDDADIRRFVQKLGYGESLPVVQDPGVISPRAFLDEVLTQRVNNPFLPDTPQRIAADTSQKMPVRFGWTLQATQDKQSLFCVPFVFAAWLRYLTGIDDKGSAFTPSPDPRMAEVRARMAGGLSDELLGDKTLFGADLVEVGLASRVREMFSDMMGGEGSVRRALQEVNKK